MKKYLIPVIVFLFFPCVLFAAFYGAGSGPVVPSSVEAEQEIGYTSIAGGGASTPNDKYITITTGATGMTVDHAWIYGAEYAAGDVNVQFAIFTMADVQVGGCSDSGIIPAGTPAWSADILWSSNKPYLAPSTSYKFQRYCDGEFTEYYEAGDAGSSYYDALGACAAGPATQSSTRKVAMTVANYDAR